MAAVDGLGFCSSVLPWRNCGSAHPWVGANTAEKTVAAVTAAEAAAPTVWGGDWNQIVRRGLERFARWPTVLLDTVERLGLRVPTTD